MDISLVKNIDNGSDLGLGDFWRAGRSKFMIDRGALPAPVGLWSDLSASPVIAETLIRGFNPLLHGCRS